MSLKSPESDARGFTLIEVVGALVVFSLGVLMVMNLSGALAVRMNSAALRSRVAVTVQNQLDSLQVEPYESLGTGSSSETIVIMGESYTLTRVILQSTAVIREVQVTLEPVDGSGPELTASTFVLRSWEGSAP